MDKGDFNVRFSPYGRTSLFNRLGARKNQTPINQQGRRAIGDGDNLVQIKVYQLPQYSSPYRYVRDGFSAAQRGSALHSFIPTSPNSRGPHRYVRKVMEVDQKKVALIPEKTVKNGKLSKNDSAKLRNKGGLAFPSTNDTTRPADAGFPPAPKRGTPINQGFGTAEKIDLRTKLNRLRKERGRAPNGQGNIQQRDSRVGKPKQRVVAASCVSQYDLVIDARARDKDGVKDPNDTNCMTADCSNINAANGQIPSNECMGTMTTHFPQDVHESDSWDLVSGLDHLTVPSVSADEDGKVERSKYFDYDRKEFLDWITKWQVEVIQIKSELLPKESILNGIDHGNQVDVVPNKDILPKTEVIKASVKRGKNGTDLLENRVHWKAKCEMYHQEFRTAHKWGILEMKRLGKSCLHKDQKRGVDKECANGTRRAKSADVHTVGKWVRKRHAQSDIDAPVVPVKRARLIGLS